MISLQNIYVETVQITLKSKGLKFKDLTLMIISVVINFVFTSMKGL